MATDGRSSCDVYRCFASGSQSGQSDRGIVIRHACALWSVSTPIVTPRSSILLVPVLDHVPQREIKLTLFLLVGSAIGGSGYWLLIRLFWLKSLPLANWLRTIALCMAATLLAIVAIEVLRLSEELTSFVLTIAWWFGFSISLYWSEMSRTTNGPAGAIENLSWKHVTS